jgi:hypothetical protein
MADAFIMSEVVKNNLKQKELLKASQTAQEGSGEVQSGSNAFSQLFKEDSGENP